MPVVNLLHTLVDKFLFLKMVVYASMGGVAHYVYAWITQKIPWSWKSLLAQVVVSGYIGVIAAEIVPDSFEYKAAVISMCGMCSLEVVRVSEDIFKKVLEKMIKKKLDVNDCDNCSTKSQDHQPPKDSTPT